MARKREQPAMVRESIVFERADPAALALFDQRTKWCSMNCGPHKDDPRTAKERQFLCPECYEVDMAANAEVTGLGRNRSNDD